MEGCRLRGLEELEKYEVAAAVAPATAAMVSKTAPGRLLRSSD
jgi:hypothetical protein